VLGRGNLVKEKTKASDPDITTFHRCGVKQRRASSYTLYTVIATGSLRCNSSLYIPSSLSATVCSVSQTISSAVMQWQRPPHLHPPPEYEPNTPWEFTVSIPGSYHYHTREGNHVLLPLP